MLSAAETLRGAMESNVPRQYQEMYDLTVQSVLDQLSAKEFEQAWADGKQYDRKQLIMLALDITCGQ